MFIFRHHELLFKARVNPRPDAVEKNTRRPQRLLPFAPLDPLVPSDRLTCHVTPVAALRVVAVCPECWDFAHAVRRRVPAVLTRPNQDVPVPVCHKVDETRRFRLSLPERGVHPPVRKSGALQVHLSQARRETSRRRTGVVNGDASIASASSLSIHAMILALLVCQSNDVELKSRWSESIYQNW